MKCNICGSQTSNVRVDTHSLRTEIDFDYEICDSCNHISIRKPLSDSELGQSYLKKIILPDSTPDSKSLKRAKEVILLYGSHRTELNIYEIGSGNCKASHSFTNCGHNGIAVDIERFNEKYSNFVYFSNLAAKLNQCHPDIFYSNHVFEHIDIEDLTSIFSLLRPHIENGAMCYFVLPLAKLSLIHNQIYLDEFVAGHKNLFSKRSMELYLDELKINEIAHNCDINIQKHRSVFCYTRFSYALQLLKSGYYKKSLVLLKHIFKSIIVGNPEELIVTINTKNA